jgi:hypothetical protein
MFVRPSLAFLLLLSFVPCVNSQQSIATCDPATESLIEVKLNVDTQKKGFEQFILSIFSSTEYAVNPLNKTNYYYNYYNEIPEEASVCVPNDDCVFVVGSVQMFLEGSYNDTEPRTSYRLSDDDIAIFKDGEKVALGPTFSYFELGSKSYTELGDCTITCKENESLVEISAYTGAASYYDWRIEDLNGGNIAAECPRDPSRPGRCVWFAYEGHHPKMCLPSDTCHRLILGQNLFYDYEEGGAPVINVTVNGELISTWESPRFQTLDFGNHCTTACGADESLFEFFRFGSVSEKFPVITWDVKDINNVTFLNGVIAWNDRNDTSLQYHQACVPSTSCLSFHASDPAANIGTFQLAFDKVISVDTNYLSGDQYGIIEYNMGQCSASDICSAGESLLDLQIETGRGVEWKDYILYWGVYDSKDHSNVDSVFSVYLPNRNYRAYRCLSMEDAGLDLYITTQSIENDVISDYIITVDGTVRDDRDVCTEGYCEGFTVTPLSTLSTHSLSQSSQSSIIGIAVGCSVAAVVIILVVVFIVRRRRTQQIDGKPTGSVAAQDEESQTCNNQAKFTG